VKVGNAIEPTSERSDAEGREGQASDQTPEEEPLIEDMQTSLVC
jgi:hypothetical protein